MSRRRGTRVIKAISSPIRLQVLNLLFEKGALSYTKIMSTLRLSPTRDAGKFAYHLKLLVKADLIEPDAETKKYRLTELGQMLINVAEDIEERVSKKRKMYVRTSRLAIEEFDRNKIATSLVNEAGVPLELAQKIARETEKRLLKFKTKYLTAPLIREFVNAVLVEKRLEEYRHKLTRLGLPVYDVTELIQSIGTTPSGVGAVHKATGNRVIEEYTLLNVLPRDIADAHLSGALHVNNLGCWILKPNEIMHDFRFFFQRELDVKGVNFTAPYFSPRSLESALLIASNALKIAATESAGEQTIDFFNIFLAPFAKGLSPKRIKEGLRFFVYNLNQSILDESLPVMASLGLELVIPRFLGDRNAIGPNGKRVGCYADFAEESQLIASLLLEAVYEDVEHRPILNPRLIIKIRSEALRSKECANLLFQCHKLAAEGGRLYFANLCFKGQSRVSYSATGCRIAADWKGDWELDTLRTGSMDSIVINLPRISYTAEGNEEKIFNLLKERLEMSIRALEIKYQTIKQRAKGRLLPFLMQKADGDQYFRIESSTRLISFVGLNEMVESMLGKEIHEDTQALGTAKRIVEYLSDNVRRHKQEIGTRTYLSMVRCPNAAKRLGKIDVESRGWAMVNTQGTKQQPFYTDLVAIPLNRDISWDNRLDIEAKFHELCPGSHLAIIQLADLEQNPNELLRVTKKIVGSYKVGLYAFDRKLSYCSNCKKVSKGRLPKCPICGSVDKLADFNSVTAEYYPFSC